MAWILNSYIVDPGDQTVKVAHLFFGLTRAEAKTYFDEHVKSCEYFAAAVAQGNTAETWTQVDQADLPHVEGGEIVVPGDDEEDDDVIDVEPEDSEAK